MATLGKKEKVLGELAAIVRHARALRGIAVLPGSQKQLAYIITTAGRMSDRLRRGAPRPAARARKVY
jgi:hypothetical protein